MSDLDEETKRILAEVGTDAQPLPDDSKKINKDKTKKEYNKNDSFNEYENDDTDPLENKDMDDKDW